MGKVFPIRGREYRRTKLCLELGTTRQGPLKNCWITSSRCCVVTTTFSALYPFWSQKIWFYLPNHWIFVSLFWISLATTVPDRLLSLIYGLCTDTPWTSMVVRTQFRRVLSDVPKWRHWRQDTVGWFHSLSRLSIWLNTNLLLNLFSESNLLQRSILSCEERATRNTLYSPT